MSDGKKKNEVYQCAEKLVKELVKRVYGLKGFSHGEKITDKLVSVEKLIEECEADRYKYTKLSISLSAKENFELYIKMKKKEGVSFFFFSFLFECLGERLDTVLQVDVEEEDLEKWVRDIYHEAVERFRQYMLDFFCIDLEDINMISATYYEGEPAKGKISFSGSKDPNVFIKLYKAEDGVTLGKKNTRKIRKLIEITGAENNETDGSKEAVFVFQEKWKHIGFDSNQAESYRITYEFTGHMSWRMYFGQKLVISYRDGTFLLPFEQSKEDLQELLHLMQFSMMCHQRLWQCMLL